MNGIVIIPSYNEAANLPRVIPKLRACLDDSQLLFVDDGSSDATADVLQAHGVNWLKHPVNLGYRDTMLTGMQYAIEHDADFVAFFDADGQHHTEDLLSLIACYEAGEHDVILGSRFQKEKAALTARGMGTRLFAWIASYYSGIEVTDPVCGLKLIGRSWIQAVRDFPSEDLHAELIVGMARNGARIAELPITVSPRTEGTSMYHFAKALLYPARTLLCVAAGYLVKTGPTER